MKLKRLVGTAVAAAVAATAIVLADTRSDTSATAVPIADEAPGYLVETFDYPGADAIKAEKGITLKRGDGHIVLADCVTGSGQLEVRSRDDNKLYCFRVTGASGFLTMEIPAVYGIRGNDYTTEATMTVDDETTTYDIKKNLWTNVGETADPEERDFMLLELRTTK